MKVVINKCWCQNGKKYKKCHLDIDLDHSEALRWIHPYKHYDSNGTSRNLNSKVEVDVLASLLAMAHHG